MPGLSRRSTLHIPAQGSLSGGWRREEYGCLTSPARLARCKMRVRGGMMRTHVDCREHGAEKQHRGGAGSKELPTFVCHCRTSGSPKAHFLLVWLRAG